MKAEEILELFRQFAPNANKLWAYFVSIITWIHSTFTKYRRGMEVTERTLRIDVGESGFLARVAAPVSAAVFRDEAECAGIMIEGHGTLMGRPMSQLRDILSAVGVTCTDSMPLRLKGSIRPGTIEVDGSGGSQSVSGLMFALPLLDSPSEIIVYNPVSVPYIRLSAKILSEYGVKTEIINDYKRLKILIPAPQKYSLSRVPGNNMCVAGDVWGDGIRNGGIRGMDIHDGDWSAAAAFLCAAAICGRCSVTGLRKDSFQADRAVLGALREAGAFVRENGGTYTVMRSPLYGFSFDCTDCPDLIPVLSAFAVYCEGITEIKGLSRLAGKESDRAASIVHLLSKAGVVHSREGDVLHIEGMSLTRRLLSGSMPAPGVYETFSDHRIVMAVMLLGLPAADIVPDDYAPLAKSMPRFKELWDSVTGSDRQYDMVDRVV
ncbi:hypothetical protein B5F83_05915 [Muribaculum sp. An289]|uniref:3-phosphoshikimate 1-carboxyvinyltransferase n=1 Tax=unclassified Muribaculum TaxID=2622126 RepID=UPI000B37A54C|nr:MULTISPECIES: hypothetical protein [unclassified Muribaculum]OUO37290.1 hypothetical protein B5F83_05915 [Muribaculum sp. An289]OUO43066.1 hypothetical protein B5F81_04645 [Muribaculum sp. An287]